MNRGPIPDPDADEEVDVLRRIFQFLLIALTCTGFVVGAHAQEDGRRKPLIRKGFETPQLAVSSDGTLLMLWARPEGSAHGLYLARRTADRGFGQAVAVGSGARVLPLDEARPALAVGPEQAVAVGWFDLQGVLNVAISRDGGRDFAAPYRVDPEGGRPEHAFVDLEFRSDGTLFAVWIDAREAPRNREEPAQLWGARITDRGVERVADLTSEHTESICGCCRPSLQATADGLEVAFRNVTDDGYRDIHRLHFDEDLVASAPSRVGSPLWKIAACPMAGPVMVGDQVLWKDGSRGHARIVVGTHEGAALVAVAKLDGVDASSPRPVAGAEDLLLVPGSPHGLVLQRHRIRWRVVNEEIPPWCHAAAMVDGQLLLVGDENGTLQMEALDPTW